MLSLPSAERFAGSSSFFLLHLLDSIVPLSPLLSLLFAFTMDLRIHRKIWNIQHSQFLWTHETEAWLFRHILEGFILLSSAASSLFNFTLVRIRSPASFTQSRFSYRLISRLIFLCSLFLPIAFFPAYIDRVSMKIDFDRVVEMIVYE